jgi:hypothetical protein
MLTEEIGRDPYDPLVVAIQTRLRRLLWLWGLGEVWLTVLLWARWR